MIDAVAEDNVVLQERQRQERARNIIYRELMKQPVGHGSINDEYRDDLHPWRDMPYPLNRVGTLTRVTRRFLPNWVNIPKLSRKLLRRGVFEGFPEIQNIFLYGDHRKLRDRLVLDALCTIGTESYNDEWKALESYDQLEGVIESSTNIPAKANKLLANCLRYQFADFFRRQSPSPYTILDVGPGTGNTSVAVFESLKQMREKGILPPNYTNRARVILYDLQPRALDHTTQRLKSYDEFIKEIVRIQGNIGELRKSEELRRYEGRVDVIIAGASLIHNTDPYALFGALHDVLSHNGSIYVWDWHCGPSFAAPTLRLGKSGRREMALRDGKGETILSIGDYCEELCEDDPNLEELTASHTMDVTYEIDEKEAAMVIDNFRTWLDLWGYAPAQRVSYYPVHGLHERGAGVTGARVTETIDEALINNFGAGVQSKKGFNCVRDFLEGCVVQSGVQPAGTKTAYYFIEGYGDDYAAVMRESGFADAIDVPFSKVFYSFSTREDSLAHTKGSDSIRFTFGCKGR
ncbi:class I SAM-dependent methyltransferase [Candidatus Woesearchaeota archaeon]|nr:class I SAM-dependent methyltransferase [Candidatus Woesearchaeota archaeon]